MPEQPEQEIFPIRHQERPLDDPLRRDRDAIRQDLDRKVKLLQAQIEELGKPLPTPPLIQAQVERYNSRETEIKLPSPVFCHKCGTPSKSLNKHPEVTIEIMDGGVIVIRGVRALDAAAFEALRQIVAGEWRPPKI